MVGVPRFARWPLRPVLADRLAGALAGAQPADQAWSDHEGDDQRRQQRAAGAERQIAEQVEDDVLVRQRIGNLRGPGRGLRREPYGDDAGVILGNHGDPVPEGFESSRP